MYLCYINSRIILKLHMYAGKMGKFQLWLYENNALSNVYISSCYSSHHNSIDYYSSECLNILL